MNSQFIPSSTAQDGGTASEVRPLYAIASLKHTHKGHEHITFWGPDYQGYRLAITDDRIGLYGDAALKEDPRLNDGLDCLAVPYEAVKALLSPEPYFANYKGFAARFYDMPGPVVDNTRANWNRLIAAAKPGFAAKPKPEVFRGKRRSFAITAAVA